MATARTSTPDLFGIWTLSYQGFVTETELPSPGLEAIVSVYGTSFNMLLFVSWPTAHSTFVPPGPFPSAIAMRSTPLHPPRGSKLAESIFCRIRSTLGRVQGREGFKTTWGSGETGIGPVSR